MMKKLWNKIEIFIVGLFAPLWGISPIVVGIYGLCVLHKYAAWLAILIFFGSLLSIILGSLIAYGIGNSLYKGLTSDE